MAALEVHKQLTRSVLSRANASETPSSQGGRIAKDVDTDTRYFDGDLPEGMEAEDSLLGVLGLDQDFLGGINAKEVVQDRQVENTKIVTGDEEDETASPYMDEKVYHVLKFWDSVVSIKRVDNHLMDFSQIFGAMKVGEDSSDEAESQKDMVWHKLPSNHLKIVPPQAYEIVDWNIIHTELKENVPNHKRVQTASGELKIIRDPNFVPEFQMTHHKCIKKYLILDNDPDARDIDTSTEDQGYRPPDMDLSQVYMLDGRDLTLRRCKVKGLENLSDPTATLVMRPDGLKVVKLSEYPTVDQIIEESDVRDYEKLAAGTAPEWTYAPEQTEEEKANLYAKMLEALSSKSAKTNDK